MGRGAAGGPRPGLWGASGSNIALEPTPTASAPLPLLVRLSAGVGHQTLKPQETKARRTPCHTLSLATSRPHGPARARGTLYPRTPAVPTNTVGAHSPTSVLRLVVSTWLMVSAPARYHAHAPCQCFSPLSVPWPLVGTLAPCQCPGALSVPGAWSVLQPIASAWPIVGAPGHCQCSGALSMPGSLPVPDPWSVPTQKTADRRPAPRYTLPNKAVEATGHKLRCWPGRCPWGVARASPRAFGFSSHAGKLPLRTELRILEG